MAFLRTISIVSFFVFFGLSSQSCRTVENEEPAMGEFDQESFSKADEDSDGKVSHQELARYKHREALAEFDLNRDNYISAAEWNATQMKPGEEDEHFNRLDKNDDGQVSEDEAVLFITEHVSFQNSFKDLDANGDMHLHWEEYAAGEPGALNITLFSMKTKAERTSE